MLIVEVLKRMFTRPGLRALTLRSHRNRPADSSGRLHARLDALIGLMAYISLNLGIFNLLPIPILDGSMILFTRGGIHPASRSWPASSRSASIR